MRVKLNLIVAATVFAFAGAASAQDMVVKIGHVGPTSGGIAHLGKDNENGARMAIDELNAKGVTIGARTRLDAHVVIGTGVSVGEDCHLYPSVTVYSGTEIGPRVRVHAPARPP